MARNKNPRGPKDKINYSALCGRSNPGSDLTGDSVPDSRCNHKPMTEEELKKAIAYRKRIGRHLRGETEEGGETSSS